MDPAQDEMHFLIIGAGITGLLLAQALKKHGVSFSIFDRDSSPGQDSTRTKGWGLALHWSLSNLYSLLPRDLVDRLPETYVDPSVAKGDSHFPFFDLDTGERRFEIRSEERIRVSREALRNLLLEGISVKWQSAFADVQPSQNGVLVSFADGNRVQGSQVVGCDGSQSQVRRQLCRLRGSQSTGTTLPIGFLGVTAIVPSSMAQDIRKLDPLFFQGSDPKTNTFMFFAIKDTPANNTRDDRDTFACQVNVSWAFREESLGSRSLAGMPADREERLKLAKAIANSWAPSFSRIVNNIPNGTDVQAIRVGYWAPYEGAWENLQGKATLIGDAAHPMPMYRGEAANHGIDDVKDWLDFHVTMLQNRTESVADACLKFEERMIARASAGVAKSVQACLDAHDYENIKDGSPLVSARAMAKPLH